MMKTCTPNQLLKIAAALGPGSAAITPDNDIVTILPVAANTIASQKLMLAQEKRQRGRLVKAEVALLAARRGWDKT